jgi:hypothetical protein
MDILGSITKAIKIVYEDLKTPDSFKIGEAFEDYARNAIFPKELFDQIHRTQKYNESKNDFSKETLNPDFLFEDKRNKSKFHVECKYRSKKTGDENALLEICKDYQLKRYQEINKDTPVFILLGLSVKEDNENYSVKQLKEIYGKLENAFVDIDISLIPISALSSNIFDLNNMIDYAISSSLPLSSKKLWNYFSNTDIFLGYCIRCKKKIPESIIKPLCGSCFNEWNKYKNMNYTEKFCHMCGKENETTFSKPYCKKCYFS